MRVLLLGTDFVYNKDGLLVPIEINTNVGLDGLERLEDTLDEILDFNALTTFISENNFANIHFIGAITDFSDRLSTLCSNLNVNYEYHKVGTDSITVPYIEDNETTLIIRSAYDTTALVDDTYCRDKVEFMKLIQTQPFASQFAYIDDTTNTLVSNITSINDNGIHPNFILKSRYPNYDENQYPKLFRVTNQEELNVVISTNVNSDYFLMEFHYNDDKKYQNHLRVIRSLNILYPPTLNSIHIGSYNKIVQDSLLDNPSPNYDLNTFELELYARYFYITLSKRPNFPKLEDSDMVELADGSFKTALDLEVGDLLKTIDLPEPYNSNPVKGKYQYQISFDELVTGVTYSTNRVMSKNRIDKLTRIAKINFTDGSEWYDVSTASYLVVKDGSVQFLGLGSFEVGDKLVLIDTSGESLNPLFVEKEVSEISIDRTFFGGWTISVEREHLFLVKADPNNSSSLQSFVSIEHNIGECIPYAPSCNGPCSTVCPTCPKMQHCYDGTCGIIC